MPTSRRALSRPVAQTRLENVPPTTGRQAWEGLSAFWLRAMLTAGAISVMVAALAAYNRLPWSDEGWFSSAAFNLARHGFMGTTVLDPTDMHLTRIDQRTYWVMPLYLVGQALWLKLFAASFFSIRSFTVVWIPVALFAFYRFLWRVTGRLAGAALATCLLALSYILIDNAGFARPDLMCCALGLCGLATYVEWRETNLNLAMLVSNVFVAASGMTHPNGIFYLLGLAAVVVYYDRRRLSIGALTAATAPYLAFGACWGLYIAEDWRAFADQIHSNGANGRWTPTLNPIAILRNEIVERYAVAFGLATGGWALLKLPALALYVAAIAAALLDRGFRRTRGTRLLLLMVALYFVALSVFNQKLTYYLIHILPWFLALVGLYAKWLWERWHAARPVIATVLIALLALETSGVLLKSFSRSQIVAEEKAAIAFARAHAQPGDRIVGSAALIYDFDFDKRLKDDPHLGATSGKTPDIIMTEPVYQDLYDSWKTVRPEDMREISARLTSYRVGFHNSCCRVYLRAGR